ncbi:hypothetical protein ACGFYQ_39570 [Streptomyces sp. NPDC048258]|uniref:hypothetical protein n=1 Tax=Streptomyces sp. NPDC048258 TaxID=3365527 RepID=UPI00371080C5
MNSHPRKRPIAAALVPFFVVSGLLLSSAATATAAAPATRQAPAAAALAQHRLPVGADVATGLHAPMSSQARATTGNKKSKKKGGLFKKLLIVVVVVIVLLVVLYGVRRALRRRSA